jgi:hypothetical protein
LDAEQNILLVPYHMIGAASIESGVLAETAAHLVDHIFPPLPMRQWPMSEQSRRYRSVCAASWSASHGPSALFCISSCGSSRPIFARPAQGAGAQARLGAISFVHRFGSALNRHVHYHCCIIHGLFDPIDDGQVRFLHARALTAEEIAGIGEQVRRRVLRWFARSGLLDGDDARDMLGWNNGGFSLDASVRIAGHDRAGLERLLRYCARPPFALERLEQVNGHQVIYRLPKPQRDGRTALSLTPLQLIDHLAALIPPPRLHRHR